MTEEPKRKSVVEWLVEQFDLEMFDSLHLTKINQAKAMEQDNIESAWAVGNLDWGGHANGKDYFEKTYTPQKPSGKLEFPEQCFRFAKHNQVE